MSKKQTNNVMLAVIATGIMSFSGVLIETAMNVTFPILMQEYSISTATVQWVTTIYLLMISITVPLSSYFIKNYSLKNLFITANLLFLAGLLLDFYAPSFLILLIGRLLQGAATGIALPLMFQIILTEVAPEKRGVMMGIGTLTTSIAPAIGPSYGGFLTTHFSWHGIYLLLVPLLIISLVLGLVSVKKTTVKKTTQLNLVSVTTLAICFSSLLVFFSLMGQSLAWLFLAIGLVSGLLFIKGSQKQSTPLIQLAILKHKTFRRLLFSFLVYQFVLLGISFILPNYIQIVEGFNSSVAGLAMFPGATIGAILAPISGRFLDKNGPRKPLIWGTIGALIGLVLITIFLTRQAVLPLLIFGHFFYMFGLGFSYSNFITTAMNYLPVADYSDGNALFNTLQQFIGAVATSIVAAVIAWQQSITGDFTLGTKQGAIWGMGLLVLLVAISLVSTFQIFQKQQSR